MTRVGRMTRAGRATRSRLGEAGSSVAVGVGLVGALLPLAPLLDGSVWVPAVAAVALPVLAAGLVLRLLRRPFLAIVVPWIVWVVAVTATQLADGAILGVVPGPGAVTEALRLAGRAADEIATGTAPLAVSAAVAFVVAAGAGLVALVADQFAAARAPLAAGLVLLGVSLLPAFAVADSFPPVGFVLVGATLLALWAIDTTARRPAHGATATLRPVALAAATGAGTLVVALVAVTLLPATTPVFDLGRGSGTSISTSLDLGDDLRRDDPVEVLRTRTDAPTYLRALTIEDLDDDGWKADPRDPSAEHAPDALPPLASDPGIAVAQTTTTVDVVALTSPRLPVPYAAVGIAGAPAGWGVALGDRTLSGPGSPPAGLRYEVRAAVARPTPDQLRAAPAGGEADPRALVLPAGADDVVGALAREVTASASTDYDRLVALQEWFRGPGFRYSLTAPSQFGYDDGGLAATRQFLTARAGYCVHFATAFTLMARSLGIPTRVVVGYLPGTPLPVGEGIASVTSRELHAWPEAHLQGIGWIGFEPTNGIGAPAALAPTDVVSPAPETTSVPTPEPSDATPLPPAPTTTTPDAPSPGPAAGAPPAGSRGGGVAFPGWSWPIVAGALLLVPAGARAARDARRLARARRGDVGAAWALLRDAATDLGRAPSTGSPRSLGMLLREAGAPSDAVARVVRTIEAAAYGATTSASVDLSADAGTLRRTLAAASSPWRRLRAVVAPASLLPRRRSRRAGPTG